MASESSCQRRRAFGAELAAAFLVACAVTITWRGIWHMVDAFLLPELPSWSAAVSLLAGTALFAACAVVQPSLAAHGLVQT